MKKYLLALMSIFVAIGLSAFNYSIKHSVKSTETFYWYDLEGNPFNEGVKTAEPSTGCTTLGQGCARGFVDIPEDPEFDPAQAERIQNP